MKYQVLILVLIIGLVQVFGQSNPNCDVGSTSPQNLKNCFDTIPYDQAQGAAIIDGFRLVIQNSSFTSLYAANLPPFNIAVDLLGGLDTIAGTTWNSYFDFHLALQDLIYKTQDAHLRFSLPGGFTDFEIIRPYQITITQKADGKAEVKLKSCAINCNGCPAITITRLQTQCDAITPHLGKVITKVNGQDAFDYYVSRAAISRAHSDVGGMVNDMLESFSLVPIHDYFVGNYRKADRFLFADGKKRKVKFITNNFNDGTLAKIQTSLDEFAAKVQEQVAFISTPSARRRSLEKKDVRFSEIPKKEKKQKSGLQTKHKRSTTKRAVTNECTNTGLDLKIGDQDTPLFHCNLVRTGETVQLFKVGTFSDSTPTPYNTIKAVVDDAVASSIDKIIIDVSNNGGGFTSLAYIYANALTGEAPNSYLQFYTPKRTLGFLNIFGTATVAEQSAFIFTKDATTEVDPSVYFGNPASDVTYPFAPGEKFVEPAYLGNSIAFDNGLKLSTFSFSSDSFVPPPIPPTPYKEVLLLTNGQCHSTCSIFLTTMKDLGNVAVKIRTLAYGGIPNLPYDTSNVACNILSGLPTMTLRGLLVGTDVNGNGGSFRQFNRYNADVRLPIWQDGSNLEDIWSLGIEQFGFSA